MARKSLDEQIEIATQKAAKEAARLKELKARKRSIEKKEAERARVHRLIQIGAICEEVYGEPITEGAMQNAFRQFLKDQEKRGLETYGTGFYSAALNRAKGTAAPEVSADGAAENNQ